MGAEIDRLEISIETEADKANKQIDIMLQKLEKLSDALASIGSRMGNFEKICSGFEKIGQSISGVSKEIDKFEQISSSMSWAKNSANGLSGFADGIERLGRSMRTVSDYKVPDFTRIVTGLNKFKSVDYQGISDASRAISTLTANLSQIDSITVDGQGFIDLANAIAYLGRATVTQAVTNIPQLTEEIQNLVTGLNGIGRLKFDTAGLTDLISAVTKMGRTTATNAIPNIQQLGTALKGLMTTLSTAPKVSQNLIDMTNALAKLARTGTSSGKAADALSKSFKMLSSVSLKTSKSLIKMPNIFSGIWRSILPILGIRQLFNWGKEAVSISSDLTEVQNVVDVTFGNMKKKVEDLASVSITDYGMSELTAKQIASRFQAMGTAIGFTQEKMSDMSIGLTKLAADMASFYNVEQEAVAKSLQSVFTGETEPLRKYGIDLTQATLQEWLHKKGIDAKVASMTQAEKTMLRYQYVMESTSNAQGDFARTSTTWSNSLRILTQSFWALGAIVGEVLINALKPFVAALNNVMQKVIQFARTVANALGAIFGWKLEISDTGITNDIDGIAAGTEDTADNLGDAASNAKKLKDYVLGIDELNIISPDTASAADDLSGAFDALTDIGDAGDVEFVKTESLFDKYKSDIDSLFELGQYIRDAIVNALNSIDWNSMYAKAEAAGRGFAEFLNGLFSPDENGVYILGEAIGTFLAGALNTAVHFLHGFADEFNWHDLGMTIAAGLNAFFSTFDFALLAETINLWAKGILATIITTLDNTDWSMIGKQIGTFLEKLDFLEIGAKVGEAIWKAINAGIEVWVGMFSVAPVETAILTAFGLLKFTGLGAIVGGKILSALTGFLKFDGIGKLITDLFPNNMIIHSIGVKMLESGKTLPVVLMSSIGAAFKTFFTSTIPSLIGGAISSLVATISAGVASLASALGISVAAAGALVVGAAVAAIAAVAAVVLNWDEIKNFFTVTIPTWWNGTVMPFFSEIPEKLASVWENVKTFANEKWGAFLDFMQGIPEKIGSIVASIGQWFDELPGKIGYALGYALGTIWEWGTNVFVTLSTQIPLIISNVVTWFTELPGKIFTAISTFFGMVVQWGANVFANFQTAITNIILNIVVWWTELPAKIYNAIITVTEKISEWTTNVIEFFREKVPQIVDNVIEFFGELPKRIVDVGKNVVEGLWEGIKNAKEWLSGKISEFCEGFVDGFKDALGIHSPSTVFAENGRYVVEGFNQGILGSDSTSAVAAWLESIKAEFEPDKWSEIFAGIGIAFQQKWEELVEWWSGTAIPEFWENMQNGVFSLENWMLLFDNMKLGMQTKWEEIFLWWTEEAMPVWWETGVDEYFNLERWLDELENVRLAFDTKWTEIDKLIDRIMTEMMKKMDERMVLIRTGWEEALSSMQETTAVVFGSVRDTAVSILDEIIAKIAEVSGAIAGLSAGISGLSSSLSGLSGIQINGISLVSGTIPGFASGGYPETGELFVARENGINEMVGRIGSRNTVANNDQIVAGITAGVASANAEQNELLREQNQLLMAILEKGFNATFEVDGRELVSAYDRRAARNGYSFT